MTIENICNKCIQAIKDCGYNDSTVFNYEGVIRRFKYFCNERNVSDYSSEIGKAYAEDVISKKTGKFSKNRYHQQGRFFRLIDSYYYTGSFEFSMLKHGKIIPDNKLHQSVYCDYQAYLRQIYENENTIHFYEYGMYCLLQYINTLNILSFNDLRSDVIISYIKSTKQTRQREILCELRGIFRYLDRADLTYAIAGIHAPRIKRIIPTLTDDELNRIEQVIKLGLVTKRDAAIVITGLSCGIRAVDLINLKLSDFNWENETITFIQSKTGNQVSLPLTIPVGNAVATYISEERPKVKEEILFLRKLAPFVPLTDHASCHAIVSRVFKAAEIEKKGRIFGMHMLRHNAASTMVKNEVPIETIAAILGHSDPNTTDIYITTDEIRLRECVLPMNGISLEVHS